MKSYRNIALAALAVSTVSVAVLSACGSSSPGNGAGGDDDDDASVMSGGGGGGDGSMSSPDGHVVPPPGDGSMSIMDAMMDAPMATVPEPDSGPPNCNLMVDPSQVFVSAGTGSQVDGACGPSTPCTTLAAAFSEAAISKATTVYIDEGTYTEQVTIPPSITQILGGWIHTGGTNWVVDCNNDTRLISTVIEAPGNANKTVIATGGSTLLQSLYITSKGSAQPSESLYGIFVTGAATTLTLVDTTVVTARGGDGANGGAGTTGATGGAAGTCPAGSNPPTSATPPTEATVGGANATYSATGASVTSGGTGVMGGAGGNGAIGQGTCKDDCATCDGSEGNCINDGPQELCGGNGPNGCGGGPAGVGGGGGGGGVSIALYAWDAMVTITRGVFQAENGGNGGTGGAYGSGGAPTSGTQGSPSGVCGTSCGQIDGRGCKPEGGGELPGGIGTVGATGAVSVGGAGGAGGDSFAYYANNNNVTVLEEPGSAHGLAGTGGMGGANMSGDAPSGANGVAAMTNE